MNIAQTRRPAAALILAAALVHGADAHEVLYLDGGQVYRGEVVDGRPHGDPNSWLVLAASPFRSNR